MDFSASATAQAFSLGLLITVFALGFRHGIDWDHIAAITDITSSQDERRRALLFGTLYALGHALVVFALGVLAILAGEHLPGFIDEIMPRIVGFTLIVLGIYVFVALIRHGRDFRLRSRWMLIFSGVRTGARWARARVGKGSAPSAIDLAESEMELGEDPTDPSLWHHGHHGRPGHHHHRSPEPDDAMMNYGRGTAFVVGMVHGIGAETPTQLIIVSGIVVAGGAATGLIMLITFLVGLLTSNTIITIGSAFGFMRASKNFGLYATVAVITAVFSLVVGTIFLLGKETVLPAIFGG